MEICSIIDPSLRFTQLSKSESFAPEKKSTSPLENRVSIDWQNVLLIVTETFIVIGIAIAFFAGIPEIALVFAFKGVVFMIIYDLTTNQQQDEAETQTKTHEAALERLQKKADRYERRLNRAKDKLEVKSKTTEEKIEKLNVEIQDLKKEKLQADTTLNTIKDKITGLGVNKDDKAGRKAIAEAIGNIAGILKIDIAAHLTSPKPSKKDSKSSSLTPGPGSRSSSPVSGKSSGNKVKEEASVSRRSSTPPIFMGQNLSASSPLPASRSDGSSKPPLKRDSKDQ